MGDKKHSLFHEPIQREQISVRMTSDLKASLELMRVAHAEDAGRPVTMNRLLIHYIMQGLEQDPLLKKRSQK